MSARQSSEPVAIVGIGCRLPGGVRSPREFWQFLCRRGDAIREVPPDRWDVDSLFSTDPAAPGLTYARRGGFVDGIDQFDPEFFGISPREAAYIDPQQRLLLETAHEAMEDAGERWEDPAVRNTGVFVGVFIHDYQHMQFNERRGLSAHTGTGTAMSITANRVSYVFDLHGPSVAVDTACSSSLVAIDMARKALLNGDCDYALAGGVNVILKPEMTIAMSKATMLSPDGRCKSFDSRANGYVRGEGAGIVLLRRLSAARAARNPIYAVIIGSSVNSDGATQGISVPNGLAQEALSRRVLAEAGVSPASVGYVEAHGTGTPVGDPIEANALGRVFSEERPDGSTCLVGSVKSNIGHLESASGVAGLIKAALCVKHGEIPANLHFEQANPAIDFARLKLRVVDAHTSWPEQEGPRRAAINSFGFGGTNAHVLIEQAPAELASRAADPSLPRLLLPAGAHAESALRALSAEYGRVLAEGEAQARDLIFTASQRRSHGSWRAAFAAADAAQLRDQLQEFAAGAQPRGCVAGERLEGFSGRPTFVFTGMGPQWWAMGRELIQDEPVFRGAIDEIDRRFQAIAGWSVAARLRDSESESRIQQTDVAQPAIFAIQAGLVALWKHWGIEPGGVIGHSVGEIAGLYTAGVLTLDDALKVAYHRSRLQRTTAGSGTMLAAGLDPGAARDLIAGLESQVAIAAINAAASVSLSGDAETLERLRRKLEASGTFARMLNVEVPYHSQRMEPIRAALLEALREVAPSDPSCPYYSTTEERTEQGRLGDAGYWWRNVRQTVQFAAAVERAAQDGQTCFLEIGPHPVLRTSLLECLEKARVPTRVISTLRRDTSDWDSLAATAAELHVAGASLVWKHVVGTGRLLSLSPYPWQRARHWAETKEAEQQRLGLSDGAGLSIGGSRHPLLGGKLDVPPTTWLRVLRLEEHAYLRDHRVQGGIVFPGTGYLEAALQTLAEDESAERLDPEPGEYLLLSEVEIGRALYLSEGEEVRLQTTRSGDRWEVRACSGLDRTWLRHAWGRARREKFLGGLARLDLSAVLERCGNELPTDYAYRLFGDVGLGYGPAFQCIDELHYGPGEAIARLKSRTPSAEKSDPYFFHPALLDACLHTIFGALNLNGEDSHRRGNVFLPVSVRQVRVYGRPGSEVWSHARIHRSASEYFVADVRVYDADRRLLAEVLDLRCQAVEHEDAVAERRKQQWMFEYAWVTAPARKSAPRPEGGAWLVFAASPQHELIRQLERRGEVCICVQPGSEFRSADGGFELDPGSAEDARRLLSEVLAAGSPLRGIAYAWCTPGDDADPWAAETRGAIGLIHLTQALEAAFAKTAKQGAAAAPDARAPWPSLWIATVNTQAVAADDPICMTHTTVWGLRRVISNESPHLATAIVDTDGSTESWAAIAGELRAGSQEDELAFRRGRRHVHRLRSYVPGGGDVERPGRFAPESDYTEIRATRPGDLRSLAWLEMPALELGENEVEIEVRACGLNFKDVLKAAGLFPLRLMEGNLWSRDTLGMECAGSIVRVGARVTELAPGMDVMALAPRAFASRVVTRHELTVPNPGLSAESAAGIPVAFLTAAMGLEVLAGLKAGERVLIHAGTGGVGQAAIQIAQSIGAEIFATAGSPEKRALLRELGVLHVFDSRSLRFAEEIREATDGEGVDVVLNSLAGEAIPASLSVLRDYGRFVELGKLDLDRDFALGLRPFTRCISFHALDLDRMLAQRVPLCGEVLRSLEARLRDGRLRALPVTVHAAADAATAFETMASASHTGKLVVALEPGRLPVRSAHDVRFRRDASYLVTGGLGGFGLQLARWLAVHGAGHLILLGRRGQATPGAEEAVRSLAALGASVQVEACDVARASDVEAVLARVPGELPLRGVFHAAAVLDDALIKNLDVDRYRRTFDPKAAGAWNLHLRTRALDLDHFMCFSSMASVLGNQGSGNYCAANAFVDALAHHRRRLGLPALTVNWGVIADVGMAADEDFYRQNLERNGLQTIHSQHCLDLLGILMQEGRTQTTVCPIDWSTWVRFNPAGGEGRLREVLKAGGPRAEARLQSTAEVALRRELDALGAAECEARAGRVVAELLADVLRMDAERLDPKRSLTSLGVDSLLGIEIKNRLDKLGLAISVTQLLSRESASTLAARLLAGLGYGAQERSSEAELAAAESPDADASPYIVRAAPREDAQLRLICFPYAGGSPAVYQRWQDALPGSIEVVSIDFRQRDVAIESGHFVTIEEAADAISEALLPLLDRPFALFGHCMGAIVMYEVAWRLQERHGAVAQHLFASGCMAPHLYNSPLVHEQEDPAFLDILHLISFSGTRALVDDDELRKDVFPGLRRDFEAVAFYGDGFRMRSPLASPITGIAASDDLFAAPKAMRAWDRYSTQRYDLALLPGDHYFIETQRETVTRLVAARLGLEAAAPASDACAAEPLWSVDARSSVEAPPARLEIPGRTARGRPTAAGRSESVRVLCFPPVGIRAADFVASFRDPGLGSEGVVYDGVEWNRPGMPLARTVEEIVERVQARFGAEPGSRTLFYGHCLGAIVAYELALRLQREGRVAPDHLVVAGVVGPHLYVAPDAYRIPTPKLVELLRVLRFPGSETLHDDGKSSEDTLERVRADLEAMARYDYRSGTLLDAPITAISFRHDLWSYPRRADTWHEHTAQECRVVEWPGDHYYAMQEPHAVAELIQEIAGAL